MSEEREEAAVAGAPSDLLMALYTGRRDDALAIASTVRPTLSELAALGGLEAVAERLSEDPRALEEYSGDGWTALHLAGYFGADAVCVCLLRAGANHGARSRNVQGNTPLHAALAGHRDRATVLSLLAAGSDARAIDAQGYVPLHLAASRGDTELCAVLRACGASTQARTSDGKSAADLAAEHGHAQLALELAE